MSKVQNSNENPKGLSLTTEEPTIRVFFQKLFEAEKSGDEFPVKFDDVYHFAYPKKDDARKILLMNFILDSDYKVFGKKSENPLGGRPKNDIGLSVKCFEFFIVRKNQALFEIYRQCRKLVFDNLAKPKELSRKDLAMMVLKAEEELEQKQRVIEHFTPKVEAYNHFMDSGKTLTMEEAAKSLSMGRNNLFALLREWGMILTTKLPAQYCIDRGLLLVKQTTLKKGSKVEPYPQIFVTPAGLNYISEKIRGKADGGVMKLEGGAK